MMRNKSKQQKKTRKTRIVLFKVDNHIVEVQQDV